MYPIFVPSKNRVNNASFLNLCAIDNIRAIVVVEKEEYLAYVEKYPTMEFIQLPLSNKGITYVRNFIKTYASNHGMGHYWMIDDDVTGVYKREGTKLHSISISELPDLSTLNAPISSLEYRQFAWSAKHPVITNSFCDSFVFINTQLAGRVYYDVTVEGKEDRDFAMQCIKKGMNTYRTTEYAFAAPANGSNKGGLKETFYDAGKEEACALAMCAKWGDSVCTKIVKPDGRHDVKIHWDMINKNTLF